MAITAKIEGMSEISDMLNQLEEKADFVASFALYEGAGEMAKAVNAAAKSIKTEPFQYAKPGATRLPSPEEKQILMENGSMGIARFQNDGEEINTSVGYNRSGYASVNWNHMSSSARTNYKAVSLKGHESNASSFLKALRKAGGGTIGKGAQNQKPVGVIANSINSGTSFMKKQPFFRKGVSDGTHKAETAIKSTVEKLFNQIIKENGAGGKFA